MPRAPYPAPCHRDGDGAVCFPPHEIHFLHPGYPRGQQTFLILPAADAEGTLHHETGRLSCALIAGNRFDGFLTEDQEGLRRLKEDTEARLNRNEYFFQLMGEEGLNSEYAIFPSFRHWCLPALPEYWKHCAIPPNPPHPMPRTNAMQVANRDITCRITKYKEATEIAHIVPASESDWFLSNGLFNVADFSDPCNAILLKSDVHKIFNAKHFTIIPRQSGEERVFVTHMFGRACPEEVVRLYHDVQLQPLYGIKVEFLLARLAWTVFDYGSRTFLEQNVPRRLKLKAQYGQIQDQECSPEQCRSYAVRPRSTSPSKRTHIAQSTTAGNETRKRARRLSASSLETTTSSEVLREEHTIGFTEIDRGRKRRRSSISDLSDTDIASSSLDPSMTEISETSFSTEGVEAGTHDNIHCYEIALDQSIAHGDG